MNRNLKERLAVPNTVYLSKHAPVRRSGSSIAGKNSSMELNLQELAMLSFTPVIRMIQNWWLRRAERHYLICADVEQQRAREAQANVAYYQKRAALARSARL